MTSPGWTSSSRSNNSSMFSVMSSAISSRTGEPNRRRASSRSSACSRSSSRSSSTSKSALRVMRKAWCSTTSRPGNSTDRKAAISSSIGRKRDSPSPPSRSERSDEPVDVVGHLDSGEVLRAVLGLLDGDRQVQAQPAHEREWVRRVDGQRREHREHLLVEVGGQPLAFGLVEFAPRDDHDALLGHRGADEFAEHLGVPGGDLLGALTDAAQLLARRQAVGRADRQAHLVAALEARHPHHVELVEVRGEDRQELGALEQRQRRVGGQRQHPRVEVEPAQFPVEVAILG